MSSTNMNANTTTTTAAKVRKPREKMTGEQKAAMAAKRAATKAAAAEPAAVDAPTADAPTADAPAADEVKKARKPREKMTDEQKAAMAAKRAATKAAAAAAAPAPAPAPEPTDADAPAADDGKKARKPREKMTDEQKAAMAAKRAATKAAAAAAAAPEPTAAAAADDGKKARKPREKMTDEQKAAMAAKRAATKAAAAAAAAAAEPGDSPAAAAPKNAPDAPKKGKKRVAANEPVAASPVAFYEMVEVEDALFMVHKESKKAFRVDMNETGDARALLSQQVGLFKDGEILPVYDEED